PSRSKTIPGRWSLKTCRRIGRRGETWGDKPRTTSWSGSQALGSEHAGRATPPPSVGANGPRPRTDPGFKYTCELAAPLPSGRSSGGAANRLHGLLGRAQQQPHLAVDAYQVHSP